MIKRPNISPQAAKPRVPGANKFDLSEIDTPTETMLAPAADLWAGLYLGTLPGHVSVEVGKETLRYERFPENGKLIYEGYVNEEYFDLVGDPAKPRGILVKGETPAGFIESLRRGGGGGFGLDGKAGSIEFSQYLALDRSGDERKLAYLGGTIGGQRLDANAVRGEKEGVVEVTGTLGELPIKQTITEGEGEEWIIEGKVGPHSYREVIERY